MRLVDADDDMMCDISEHRPRKKPFYGRSATPRTRSGCYGCRKRKLKCDEKKPTCKRCHDNTACCQYGLKLTWKSVLPEKRMPQYTTPFRFQDPSFFPFLNTHTEDFSVHSHLRRTPLASDVISDDKCDESDCDQRVKTETASPTFSSVIRSNYAFQYSQLGLSSTDSTLLDFYVNGMCSTCSLLDGHDNGYKHVILPISINSPLLLKSVLAVSANHLRVRDSRYYVTALQYRGSTLKSLRRLISSPDHTSKSELLSTVLMLCFFDISDGCQSDWIRHLKGARRIMLQPENAQDGHASTAVITFLAQYFASHNIMAYTALADPTKEKALKIGGRFWLSQITRPEQEIDSIIGCSTELMTIILDICSRVRKSRSYGMSVSEEQKADQSDWKRNMESRLLLLEQHVTYSSGTTAATARLQHTATAFRDAAMILLQYLNPEATSASASNIKTGPLVKSIFSLLEKCPIDPSGSRSSSLWPFFIAACHVDTEEQRLFVLKRFYIMENKKRFGNITPVREVIECVWKRKDLRADEANPRNENGIGCFEWEDAMAFLGSNLSLT